MPSGRPPATAEEAALQVALACQIIAKYGHEDLTLGHASVRGPSGDSIFIKKKGKALRDVRPEDVMEIALDDPEGYLTPGAHLETTMHIEAYLARSDVGAAIHTHPLHSVALGATGQALATLSHDGLLFPDGVPVFSGTAGLVTAPAQAREVAAVLEHRRVVLLRNHGILAVGEDIRWAVLAAITLERAARMQFVASAIGGQDGLVPIPDSVIAELAEAKYSDDFTEEYWQDWCRLVSQ